MIVDAHCHIWEEKLISRELKEILHEIAKQFGYDPKLIMDGTVERLIREMDEAGIDKTVLLALDYEFAFRGDVTFGNITIMWPIFSRSILIDLLASPESTLGGVRELSKNLRGVWRS